MILLFLVGLMIIALLVVVFISAAGARETSEQRLRRQVIEADQRVQEEYRYARQAMNIAAGQAWRNLVD